jgi:hypothetical protein|tara:strand:- start:527 stop:739 length:213 start_codon:yes stop_codon:yes gene_type:complete
MKKETLKECNLHFAKTSKQQVWKLLEKRRLTKEKKRSSLILRTHPVITGWQLGPTFITKNLIGYSLEYTQ